MSASRAEPSTVLALGAMATWCAAIGPACFAQVRVGATRIDAGGNDSAADPPLNTEFFTEFMGFGWR
mgnify:CR=1 FL=1